MAHTDVCVVTAGGDSVRAHRAILASHSTFLRQLLIANMVRGCDDICRLRSDFFVQYGLWKKVKSDKKCNQLAGKGDFELPEFLKYRDVYETETE